MKLTGIPEKPHTPTLFRKYPELNQKIARISLGTFPTPVQQLNWQGYENLWIKRDDLSSPVYGGNKIRKLEFILAEARRRNTRHLITFGGLGTNHGLATAIFCNQLGIECTLLLFHQPLTENVKHNLILFEKYHARVVYKKTRWRTVLSYYLFSRMSYPSAYFVFAGGSNPIGTIGYVNAAFELKDQIEAGETPEPKVIFCPLGSGGTLAGLSLGLQLANLQTQCVGVRVSESHLGPFQACTQNTVEKLMNQTYDYIKKRSKHLPDVSLRTPTILSDYFGEGYGKPIEAGNRMSKQLKETDDIMLDPTYTAKTFAAVNDYCQQHKSNSGPILYWHTYNSVDLSTQVDEVDKKKLSGILRSFVD